MQANELKAMLHQKIEEGDEKLLVKLYAVVSEYDDKLDDLEMKRKTLIFEERSRYLNGDKNSYTWQEVKSMALNKQKPNDL
jgi:hypothetical protein